MMVVAGEPGLLQLLSGGKCAAAGRALERVRELCQLMGLCSISVVACIAGSFLQLTCNFRDRRLELLGAPRLQLLQLIEKLSGGRKTGHISLLLDRGS